MTSPVILVVEPNLTLRHRIGEWLEAGGYDDVMLCPGPSEPHYRCVGVEPGSCPLAKAADVVVVDLHQRSDDALQGVPGWELLFLYLQEGKRVVAITGPIDAVRLIEDDYVRLVERPIDAPRLVAALSQVGASIAVEECAR